MSEETYQPIKRVFPRGSKVLVKRDGTPDRIGSIVVPEVAKEAERPFWCTVVSVGPGDWVPTGERKSLGHAGGPFSRPDLDCWTRTPMLVKPGDRVLINRYAGPEVMVDGVEHMVLDHTDLKALAED